MRSWADLSLWDAQNAALKVCKRYFDAPERSALVQMPTGAGKTGVIAVVSSLRSQHGRVLVLAPSEALVDQLYREIRSGFWKTVQASSKWKLDGVTLLLPSLEVTVLAALRDGSARRQVLVGTLQALQQTASGRPELFRALCQHVRTVLVDEGHREPALTWADAVRRLDKPTVLFSATPYRNDQRLFNVSDKFMYYLSFDAAVQKRYIRDVAFSTLSTSKEPREFARRVVASVNDLVRKHQIATDAKVIIRAANADNVNALHNAFSIALSGSDEGCMSFHETFTAKTPGRFAEVPNLQKRTERYYIHQFKLIEGLDEPRFEVFVPYDDFSNTRQLVQQVGRIIRNPTPGKRPSNAGVMLVPEWSDAKQRWEDYRRFDEECSKRGSSVIRTEDVLASYLETLPSLSYMGGKFVKRANFDDPRILEDLSIPRSCVVLLVSRDASMQDLAAQIRQRVEQDDRVVLREKIASDCYVALSVRAKSSEYLSSSSFPEFALQLTVARIHEEYLFLTDTEGLWIDDATGVSARVATDKLQRLLPDAGGTRISYVVARNSDIGPTALRSRSLSARSLDEAAPFMGDYLHMVAQARGRIGAGVSRYVGFSRSRVRDEHLPSCDLSEYMKWTSGIAAQLDVARRPARYLQRFSVPCLPPPEPNPRNILLDIESLEGDFEAPDGSKLSAIEDLCADVVVPAGLKADEQSSFEISIGNTKEPILIRYDKGRRRYKLESARLETFVDKGNKKVNLLSRLNQRQAFRVLCASSGYVYSSGEFFKIDDEIGLDTLRTVVRDLLTPIDALVTIGSEKGTGPGDGVHWVADSLFHFIDQNLRGHAGSLANGFEEIICDDMSNEVADFLAYRSAGGGKVVFIHAKAHDARPGAGASKLYDVCSQAMKNLVYLRHGARRIPSQVRKWDGQWSGEGYQVAPRIRLGTGSSAEVRERLRLLLDAPNTTREMWLALGGILSRDALIAGLSSSPPAYFSLQAAYLLMSADAACKSVGVGLRVFCPT